MPERETELKNKTDERQPVRQVPLKPAGEAHVKPQENPVEPPADKRIHPRRPLPLVPEGPDNQDEDDQERDQ
jgi:hypothetical protein